MEDAIWDWHGIPIMMDRWISPKPKSVATCNIYRAGDHLDSTEWDLMITVMQESDVYTKGSTIFNDWIPIYPFEGIYRRKIDGTTKYYRVQQAYPWSLDTGYHGGGVEEISALQFNRILDICVRGRGIVHHSYESIYDNSAQPPKRSENYIPDIGSPINWGP
jgi:hypothetical protein